ncbi:unnamed protein product [Dovyalis caffra]|uniref:Uncharacterized protein n=1 Tax=Dovyalis caffra TaxID=77055 RepID=A0AAV1SJW0_9ROSI|nr:unnamed protein product [Dovyalis caffra]
MAFYASVSRSLSSFEHEVPFLEHLINTKVDECHAVHITTRVVVHVHRQYENGECFVVCVKGRIILEFSPVNPSRPILGFATSKAIDDSFISLRGIPMSPNGITMELDKDFRNQWGSSKEYYCCLKQIKLFLMNRAWFGVKIDEHVPHN